MQVLRDLSRPDLPPDVVFDTKGFSPLTAAPDLGSSHEDGASASCSGGAGAAANPGAQQLLSAWRPAAPAAEARATAALLAALLRAFLAHQRRRLAALQDERMTFELGMLEDTGCSELLLTGEVGQWGWFKSRPAGSCPTPAPVAQTSHPSQPPPDDKDPSGRRACFGIPIRGLDLSCAEPLLLCQRQARPSGPSRKPAGQQQQPSLLQPSPSGSRPPSAGLQAEASGGDGPATAAADGAGAAGGQPDVWATESSGSGAAGAAASADGGQQQQQQDSGFTLHVAFRTGPGAGHAPPALQLQAPGWFGAACLPPLPLPAWNAQAPLLEYVPLVRERLQQHLAQHCAAAAARYKVRALCFVSGGRSMAHGYVYRQVGGLLPNPPHPSLPTSNIQSTNKQPQIFEELAALLGPPLEVRMASSPPTAPASTPPGNAPSSYSAAAAAAAASNTAAPAGSGGAGVSVAAFQVLHEQQPLLVFFEVLPRFPDEQPVITLQSPR
jgi:hypothetical protein